jgi:4-amino-4-deoxy-L-arabinose transferase-like glycosyltransferase
MAEAPARRPALLGLITLLSLVNGLLWASIVPPWQAPDEPKHFEYVRLLKEKGELVAFATEAEAADPELQRWILASMDAHRFWFYGRAPGYDPAHPPTRFADVWLQGSHTAFYRSSPVYYWLVARLQPADRLTGLYVARLVSVLLGALTVLFIGLTARELFPDDALVRYGAPLFAALHPMFASSFAAVNNDTLAHCLTAFAFLLLARLLVRGANPARLILLVAVIAAAVLTKRTTLFLVPSALCAVGFWLALRRRRPAVALGAALALVLVAGLGLWQWWATGGWERLPQDLRWTALRYFFNEPDQPGRVMAYLRAQGIGPVMGEYLRGMHDSFWASFGWQVVNLPALSYVLLGGLLVVALVGAARRLADEATPTAGKAMLLTAAVAVALQALAATAFFVSYLYLPFPPLPQGRYLFGAMTGIALIVTAGLGAWLPAARRLAALRAFTLAMGAFDAVTLLGFVVPYFYR